MKKEFIITIICFGIVLFGGLFAATQARAAVYYVTTTVDRDGTCVYGDCSLREAVKAANATAEDDSIFFDAPMQGQTFVLTLGAELKVDNPNSGTLVISGEFGRKTRIQGSGSRIFYVANPSPGLELNNLVLTGGNGGGTRNGFGGAIHAYNAPLTLNYVDLIGNAAQTQGGRR